MALGRITTERWEILAAAAHFKARELARLSQLSLRQLQRNFRRDFDCSPQTWLNERRIIVARQMLLSGLPVKAVAIELGFKQSSHFCRQFKQLQDMTPSEFVVMRTKNAVSVARR